jgi:hypothetical protein
MAPKKPGLAIDTSRDVIAGAQGVLVPPSPGFQNGVFDQNSLGSDSPTLSSHKQAQTVSQDRTGSGVKKTTKNPVWKPRAAAGIVAALDVNTFQKPFRFLQLPGG